MSETRDGRLEEAFRHFGELSERLEASYRALQSRVSELTGALTAARLRRDAEAREKERLEERLAELLVLLPAGVVIVGPTGEIREINPTAEDLLDGASIGDWWFDVVPETLAEPTEGYAEGHFDDGRTLAVATRPLGCGERLLVVSDVSAARPVPQAVNVVERAAMRAETHRSRNAGNPLSAATLQTHRLRQGIRDTDPRLAAELDRLRAQLWRVESAADSGDAMPACEGEDAVAVSDLLASVRREVEPQIRGRAYLILRQEAPGAVVDGNRTVVLSSLVDLVLNAAKAAKASGRGPVHVEVSARLEADCVRFRVADDGPGVPEALRERIFEPSADGPGGGKGLGLAIVRNAIEGLGGTIECSGSEFGGAAFDLHLPRFIQEIGARPQELCA